MWTRCLVPTVMVLALAPSVAQQAAPEVSRERLRADLDFLASPPLEGRASLTQGAHAAAWFLATELRKAGLQPANGASYLQPFDLLLLRLDRERSVVAVRQSGEEARFTPVAVAFPDPTGRLDLTLDVVFAGYGITAPEFGYDDYVGVDVRGKAVLVFDHEPREDDPGAPFHGTGLTLHANAWTKTWTAQRHGAAALLVVTEPVNSHRTVPRPSGRANAPPQALVQGELRIPRITIPAEAAAALLKGTGRTPADWQRAIDDAMRPASRLLTGVLGSYHYVAKPLRPLSTTRAVINLDMIGRNEEHTPESAGAYEITAGNSDQLNMVGAIYSPDLANLLRREAAGAAGLRLSDKFDRDSSMRALFRCDHLPFLQKGIPAVWLFGGFHPGYHEPVDTVDRIDFDKMARTVRLTVDAVRALASTPTPPGFRYPARP